MWMKKWQEKKTTNYGIFFTEEKVMKNDTFHARFIEKLPWKKVSKDTPQLHVPKNHCELALVIQNYLKNDWE